MQHSLIKLPHILISIQIAQNENGCRGGFELVLLVRGLVHFVLLLRIMHYNVVGMLQIKGRRRIFHETEYFLQLLLGNPRLRMKLRCRPSFF
ncbi:hypothetical protein D3C77_606590 [compost metagenome]